VAGPPKPDDRPRPIAGYLAAGVLLGAVVVALVAIVTAGPGGAAGRGGKKGRYTPGSVAPRRLTALPAAARAAHCVVRAFPQEGRTHVTGHVRYRTNPPTSGNHYPIPQDDGAYTKMPPLTHVVHTLEHGRIEIQYSPTLDPKRIAQLGGFFNQSTAYMVLFPNTLMPYQVAVTAWGHLAGCKKVNNETFDVIRAFKQRYLGQAPEPVATQPTNF
jgi:hypothetical protein